MNASEMMDYIHILEKELIPAFGCTEPIAIAYAAAMARKYLDKEPDRMKLSLSTNIIKNAMGVAVPNSGGMKGVAAAAILGMTGGDSDARLEVLTEVTQRDVERTVKLLESDFCEVNHLQGDSNLHIIVELYAGEDSSLVEIIETHLNIIRVERNGELLYHKKFVKKFEDSNYQMLSIEGIIDFAETVELDKVKVLLDKQIQMNSAISEEGLRNSYGASVGQTILAEGDSFASRASARAAAGSDARMDGCCMPVVINSGSGNQGITVTMPVIEYAEENGCSREKVYRALLISNLTAIHLKSHIGSLSAFCGAVCAATGAAAAITWLSGGGYQEICDSITNTLGTIGGMVCDGAKPSCAAKIAAAVNAAVNGFYMSKAHHRFEPGEGIIKENIENTIDSIGTMGREGMKETDNEIIRIMLA